MTDKQINFVTSKIDRYKKALAADKKYLGGQYHDGQGLRYLIPELYIKIRDYKGGLRYLNWFEKNFPKDSGYPIFLFESAFILYKCGKLTAATQKAERCFFTDTNLFDQFLGKTIIKTEKDATRDDADDYLTEPFPYSNKDPEFAEFSKWIASIFERSDFMEKANEFFKLSMALEKEPVGPKRTEILKRLTIIQSLNI